MLCYWKHSLFKFTNCIYERCWRGFSFLGAIIGSSLGFLRLIHQLRYLWEIPDLYHLRSLVGIIINMNSLAITGGLFVLEAVSVSSYRLR